MILFKDKNTKDIAKPATTSGTTKGIGNNIENIDLPLKKLILCKEIAAKVPKITAPLAASEATLKLVKNAAMISSSCQSFLYQLKENSCQTVIRFELLKEKTMSIMIGI